MELLEASRGQGTVASLSGLSRLSGLLSLSGSPIGQTNRTKQTKATR